MFLAQDAAVFVEPDSFDKLDAVGHTYFPQLGGLLHKAAALIHQIYGISVFDDYKTSYSPTPGTQRRKGVSFNPRKHLTKSVRLGLRAQGEPTHLTKSDGQPAQIHFATLQFGIDASDGKPELAVGFEPYILNYDERHREAFASHIQQLGLACPVEHFGYFINRAAPTLAELMRQPGAIVRSVFYPGIEPTQVQLAELVAVFAAMFPLLDVFTRLSNGNEPSGIDYVMRYSAWFDAAYVDFAYDFAVEPLRRTTGRESEEQVRRYFEQLLGYEFPTIRPDWLRDQHSGNRLELDGYCEELNLAFEYNGEYHYIPVELHHQERSLEAVQEIDSQKLELCRQNGVDLIVVPYWKKQDIDYIIGSLRTLQRPDIEQRLRAKGW